MDWRKHMTTYNGHRPPGWPLPHGVIDRFWQEAAHLHAVMDTLRDVFRAWGYTEFIPPTFEYADTLNTGAGPFLQEQMYRFFDRDGKTLALRPDMTIPTARLVGSKLFDQPFPQRFFYSGPVFRYTEPRAGLQREFYQAGVELIGVERAAGDGEILALAVEALRSLGLREFRIVLGQMEFFRGLLDALNLPPKEAEALRSALDRKSAPELQRLVSRWGVKGRAREAVLQLPYLHGAGGVLKQAQNYTLNARMAAALDRLHALEQVLDAYGVTSHMVLDLAEVRGMEYYTGITFEGFVPGLGVALLSGGRYDDLVGKFGPPQPAVGFAITLDRVLRAREEQGIPPTSWTPHLVVGGAIRADTVHRVQRLRAGGRHVAWHYTADDRQSLWTYARAMHIPWAVWCDDPVWVWHEGREFPLPAGDEWSDHVGER
ncbi:MAG: ATP phosphoribosyltransferase regulatory subunit [Chloroflexi bacterium]|nr:ATP phosphoribosyltransferase regulatory subunit [Chloroflexota bacterium]